MATNEKQSPLAQVEQLQAVAKTDTVYADLYRRRARARLASILPVAEYDRLKRTTSEIAAALKESAAAVDDGDWPRVQRIAANASRMQQELDARKSELTFAEALYDHPQEALDPFSPGLERAGAVDVAAALAQVRAGLAQLQEIDAEWADFYARRAAFFAKIMPEKGDTGAAVKDPAQARREAMEALEHGDMDRLHELAASVTARSSDTDEPRRQEASAEGAVDLAIPFDASVAAKAKAFGLEVVRLDEVPHGAEIIRRHALTAAFFGRDATRDGVTRAKAVYEDPALQEFPAPARELVSQLAINLFVNSGGARYLPRLVAETLLLEGFPETDDPPVDSPLLKALGLERRKAVSRLEIDIALEERGIAVLEQELGLDPRAYKLVCIPCDVYVLVGRAREWGMRQLWTHFDGYQLTRNGRLRALVGGDVRYGGVHDLVSISRDDERDKVITRFAVVRRERLMARWL
jgi:hypothetical protein